MSDPGRGRHAFGTDATKRNIRIEEHDPAWALRFTDLGRRLREALGDVALRIDHIGSTAVPGLAAKPVVCARTGRRPTSTRRSNAGSPPSTRTTAWPTPTPRPRTAGRSSGGPTTGRRGRGGPPDPATPEEGLVRAVDGVDLDVRSAWV